MEYSIDFYQSILDSLSEHIVVINTAGMINFVNSAWIKFARDNSCNYRDDWKAINYLQVCDDSAAAGEAYAASAAKGLRSLIGGKIDSFQLEYPCHSPTEQRWFILTGTPMKWSDVFFVVISHQDITQRKLAEERVKELLPRT
jgi:PAS domain-containing protein